MKGKLIAPLLTGLLIIAGCQATPPTSTTAEKTGKVVSQKDLPKGIVPVEAMKEHYPAVVASFDQNKEEKETTYGGSVPVDYLEKYPYLKSFYKGYVFEHQYDRARGHVYALEDVKGTKRPKAGATCFSCKVGQYHEALAKDPGVAKMDFDEFAKQVTVGMTCWDCHKETPGTVQLSRGHFTEQLENAQVKEAIDDKHLACAQCHVEYYLAPETKITTLPWSEGLGCDEAYQYYQKMNFSDWEHPETGAKLLKAQHPETETFVGGVHDKAGANCTTCHMPTMEVSGEKIKTHHWTSPLKTPKESCLPCHKDLDETGIIKLAEGVQKPVVEKTDALGKKLADYIAKLGEAKAAGKLDDAKLKRCQEIHREAQFYWDYVFVENGEGFHNWEKQNKYLDHAEKLMDEGLGLLG